MVNVTFPVVFAGLDYHSRSVQVCVLSREGKVLLNVSCGNDWRAVVEAVRRRCGEVQVQAAIESCCGAANFADFGRRSFLVGCGGSLGLRLGTRFPGDHPQV